MAYVNSEGKLKTGNEWKTKLYSADKQNKPEIFPILLFYKNFRDGISLSGTDETKNKKLFASIECMMNEANELNR